MSEHIVTLELSPTLMYPVNATCSCGRKTVRERQSLTAGDRIELPCGGVAVVEADFLEEVNRIARREGDWVRGSVRQFPQD